MNCPTWLKEWINLRTAIHIPLGWLLAYLIWESAPMGITTTFIIVVYEVMQDWRKKDWSFRDMRGVAGGLASLGTALVMFF